jgi:hypothetical protein
MVFDLPFFVSSPPTQLILPIVSALNVSLSATAEGGSETTPYLGNSGSRKKWDLGISSPPHRLARLKFIWDLEFLIFPFSAFFGVWTFGVDLVFGIWFAYATALGMRHRIRTTLSASFTTRHATRA